MLDGAHPTVSCRCPPSALLSNCFMFVFIHGRFGATSLDLLEQHSAPSIGFRHMPSKTKSGQAEQKARSTVGCKSFGRNIRLGFKQQQQDLIYNHLCLRK